MLGKGLAGIIEGVDEVTDGVTLAGGEADPVVTMLLKGRRSLVNDFETNSVSCSIAPKAERFWKISKQIQE